MIANLSIHMYLQAISPTIPHSLLVRTVPGIHSMPEWWMRSNCKTLPGQLSKFQQKKVDLLNKGLCLIRCQKAISTCGCTLSPANLGDYKYKVNSTFPKVQELQFKESRYTEVMAALKKEAEEKSKQEQNPSDIPWYRLEELSPDEIRGCVRTIYENVISRPEAFPVQQFRKWDRYCSSSQGVTYIMVPNRLSKTYTIYRHCPFD